MEFRLGTEQRVCSRRHGIQGGSEHEAWFREDLFTDTAQFNLLHGERRDASVGHF